MEQTTEKKAFNKRAFASISMFISVLCLPFSGIMNHNLQFEQFSVQRHFWMSLHNIAALLFVVFAIMHIFFNWRALINYVNKAKKTVMSKEALAAVLVVVSIIMLFSSHALHTR